MQSQAATAEPTGLVTGLRILSAVVATGVVIQAWLGSTGFFQGVPGRIDAHEMIANLFFVFVVVQVGLALFAMQKGMASRAILILAVVGLALTVAQIGLGYGTRSTESGADALAWHLPVGVALMGVTAVTAALAWNAPSSQRDA